MIQAIPTKFCDGCLGKADLSSFAQEATDGTGRHVCVCQGCFKAGCRVVSMLDPYTGVRVVTFTRAVTEILAHPRGGKS